MWGQLAAARQAQLDQQPALAVTRYLHALPLATTYELAFRIGDGLRDVGDASHALEAYAQAAAIPPGSIWPLLAAGTMLAGPDPIAARQWFERAERLDPSSGYPDFSLGSLLERSDPAAAQRLFQQAATKQPEVDIFRSKVRAVPAPPVP